MINIGVVAHVDAGKTSLTERLLYEGGAIDAVGRVDHGTTVTDGLDLERRRGITIRTAVAAFDVAGTQVNLIDTPGHADFVAEVERAFAVLDGVVLVVSAVEGVQAHTRLLYSIISRRALPMIIFVNKIDRRGADPDRVIAEIERRLTRAVVPLTGEWAGEFAEIAAESRAGLLHPVLTGSALTGQGVDRLLAVLPAVVPRATASDRAAPAAQVFSIDRSDGRRSVLARMRAGAVTLRQPVRAGAVRGKITGLEVLRAAGWLRADRAGAGEVVRIRGIAATVGRTVTADISHTTDTDDTDDSADSAAPVDGSGVTDPDDQGFAPPGLEVTVATPDPTDAPALHRALSELADEDPRIGLRVDPVDASLTVSVYGEVQQEVISARLEAEHGLVAVFGSAVTVHQERLAGSAGAFEVKGAPTNPFLAEVGLRIEPRPVGEGRSFTLEVELGSMPPAFFAAVRDTVEAVLDEGRHGWPVADVRTVMTHSGYFPRQSAMHAGFDKTMSSTGADFRGLTRLIMGRCLAGAGTVIEEPVDAVELHAPTADLPVVLDRVARARGTVLRTDVGDPDTVVTGELPAAEVGRLRRLLPDLTGGEAVLTTRFDHWAAITGDPARHRRPRREDGSGHRPRPGSW